jgi:phosphatidylinositol alpha-1,6-mannosyltransferase
MVKLTPGVDPLEFRPGAGGMGIRAELGIPADRPVVICVSRMVQRKGQDMLIRAWPAVRSRSACDPLLMLVGDGPYRPALNRLARQTGVADSVLFTGPVSWDELPAYYDAGNVFAMPCRTRRAGLDVEGLGIVYLEASATGLPVIGGDSGGAPDAVLDGETGYVVPGRDQQALTDRLVELLRDPAGASAMGDKGQAWIDREWTWDLVAGRLQQILAGKAGLTA